MDPYLQEGHSFRTRGSVRHIYVSGLEIRGADELFFNSFLL